MRVVFDPVKKSVRVSFMSQDMKETVFKHKTAHPHAKPTENFAILDTECQSPPEWYEAKFAPNFQMHFAVGYWFTVIGL